MSWNLQNTIISFDFLLIQFCLIDDRVRRKKTDKNNNIWDTSSCQVFFYWTQWSALEMTSCFFFLQTCTACNRRNKKLLPVVFFVLFYHYRIDFFRTVCLFYPSVFHITLSALKGQIVWIQLWWANKVRQFTVFALRFLWQLEWDWSDNIWVAIRGHT